MTTEEALAQLQTKAGQLTYLRRAEDRQAIRAREGSLGDQPALLTGRGNPSKVATTCNKCGKPGHYAAKCWKGMKCDECGKAHPTNVCRRKQFNDWKRTQGSNAGGGNQVNDSNKNVAVPVADKFKKNGNAYLIFSFDNEYRFNVQYEIDKVYTEDTPIGSINIMSNWQVNTVIATPYTLVRTMPVVSIGESDQFALEMQDCMVFHSSIYTHGKQHTTKIIVDSGATMHMSELLCRMRTADGSVKLGTDGVVLPVVGVGQTHIDAINNVLYVPTLNINILSVSEFTIQGYTASFDNNQCTIYNSNTNDILLIAYLEGGLYYVDEFYISILYGQNHLQDFLVSTENIKSQIVDFPTNWLDKNNSVTSSTDEFYDSDDEIEQVSCNYLNTFGVDCNVGDGLMDVEDNSTSVQWMPLTDLNPLEKLHRNLGHLSKGGIMRLPRENMVKQCEFSLNDIKDIEMRPCFECMKGRMKALPHGKTSKHEWTTMQKIAIDYKGPFSIQSYHKKKGVMLISDYASNFVYAYLVRTKSESVDALEDFQRKIVKRYGYTTLVLQSDADCIFTSKRIESWLKKNNIRLELSAPYVHSQNGQIERDVQNVFDKTRTLMHSYNVPPKYWEFAVKTAVYLINRSPTSGREVTPYEAVTRLKPSIMHLKPFWSPGVLHITREERGNNPYNPKAEECRLLGYDEETAGDAFIVLNLRTKRVVTRANCIFDPVRITELFEGEEEDIVEEEEGNGEDDLDIYRELRENEYVRPIQGQEEVIETVDLSELEEALVPLSISDKEKRLLDDDDASGVTDMESVASDFGALAYWDPQSYWMISSLGRWHNDIVVLAHSIEPLPPNPKNAEEALSGPDGELWRLSMVNEVDAFLSRNLWGVAEQKGRAMKTKLIFTYKYTPDFQISRKTRIVVCGYSQIKGIDYLDTYSPTTTTAVVFFLLHYCSVHKWHSATFDVSSAYLEGDADVKLFAWLPAVIMKDNIPYRVEIKGNWYGEKQAGRIWNMKLDHILTEMNFTRCPMMPCLYKWSDDIDTMLITIHVDDGLLISNNPELFKIFMDTLLTHIRKAVLSEEYEQYLKLSVHQEEDGRISVCQQEYIEAHFPDTGKKVMTPMNTSINLRRQVPNNDNESLLQDTGKYRYLADRGRPNTLVTTSEISIGGAVSPSDEHIKASKRLKDFLITTKESKLYLGGNDPIQLFGYSDAAYITDGNAKSRLGGCLFLGTESGAFFSYSRSDTIRSSISHSSTEAEIKAIDELCREVEYWIQILEFTGVNITLPVKIFVDNKSAIELCRVLKTNHQVKHINMRIHYINDLINRKIIELIFVPTDYNVADILTKGLNHVLHNRHSNILLNGHSGKLMEWLLHNSIVMDLIIIPSMPEITGVCHEPTSLDLSGI